METKLGSSFGADIRNVGSGGDESLNLLRRSLVSRNLPPPRTFVGRKIA